MGRMGVMTHWAAKYPSVCGQWSLDLSGTIPESLMGVTGALRVEMFLDRTDLSKTVDRHGTERCHVLSRSSRFLAAVLVLNEAPFLQKTAENGKNRPWQARTGRSSLSEYSNSTSFSVATRFFHVFTPFFLCFWPVYNRSRVCRNTVEGLSTLVQGSVEAFKAVFVLFPSKFVYWWPVWSLIGPTPPKDPSAVQLLQL